ncbi:MAG: 3'-5' exonuclease [Solirubrobacteraceae bacterium]
MAWGARGRAAEAFRHADAPDSAAPWREADWCAVDLELTGLDPGTDEIIAIGAVPIHDGRLILGRSYYSLVRPGRAPSRTAVVIHKLRTADLADAPPLSAAIDGLLAVLAGTVPVFHTAWVEQAFLGRALRRLRVRLPDAADTEVLGRRWAAGREDGVPSHLGGEAGVPSHFGGGGGAPSHLGLARLAELLGLPAEPPHHALGDALTTAKAFIALASLLDAGEPQTAGSLVRAGADEAPAGARRFGPA